MTGVRSHIIAVVPMAARATHATAAHLGHEEEGADCERNPEPVCPSHSMSSSCVRHGESFSEIRAGGIEPGQRSGRRL
jgi:hypothetical protein